MTPFMIQLCQSDGAKAEGGGVTYIVAPSSLFLELFRGEINAHDGGFSSCAKCNVV